MYPRIISEQLLTYFMLKRHPDPKTRISTQHITPTRPDLVMLPSSM